MLARNANHVVVRPLWAGKQAFFEKRSQPDQLAAGRSIHCEETYHERVEPKHSVVINGVDADSWRIRDAKTGEVITDLVPEVPDTMTYVTVP